MRRLKQVKRKMVRAEGLRQMAGTHFTHTEKRSIYIYIYLTGLLKCSSFFKVNNLGYHHSHPETVVEHLAGIMSYLRIMI